MSSSSPICICGANLVQKKANQCYHGAESIECDGCGALIQGAITVYHCTDKADAIHAFGFDLCKPCGDQLESTITINKQPHSTFLVIVDKLSATRSPLKGYKSPFKWQSLCYYVNGIKRKVIDQKQTVLQFHSISDYILHYQTGTIRKHYVDFNYKSSVPSVNAHHNNNKYRYQGNINDHHLSTYVSSFPALIAQRKQNTFEYHDEFKKAMNLYQDNDKDILDIKISKSNKWKVVGLIDPDKHLSSLDHSLNASLNKSDDIDTDIMNYHHWIPSVFKVNDDLTQCRLLSEIPNLDPYKYADTLYRLIERLFLYYVPQFENVTNYNLRNVPLKVIVKAQDYQLFDCAYHEAYIGNMHKEGLYENIIAASIYYYDIDDGIKGGELQVSSVIDVEDTNIYFGVTELKSTNIKLKEQTSLVLSNKLCYHKVTKLYGNGSRKIFVFFLIAPDLTVNIPIDARFVVVNWKYHAKRILVDWLKQHMYSDGYGWILDIVSEYVVGDRVYIETAIKMYNKCRAAFHHEITYSEEQITSTGRRKYVPRRRHHCNRD